MRAAFRCFAAIGALVACSSPNIPVGWDPPLGGSSSGGAAQSGTVSVEGGAPARVLRTLSCPSTIFKPPRHTTFDLGAGEARAINSRGQVVGAANVAGARRAFILQGNQLIDLGDVPGFPESEALDINTAGSVVGTFYDAGHNRALPFVWRAGALRILDGVDDARAIAINDDEQILLDARAAAMLWAEGTITQLFPPNEQRLTPVALNNLGEVLGSTAGAVWLWHAGTFEQLPLESAAALNDSGAVVGSNADQGIIWANSTTTDITTQDDTPGTVRLTPLAINTRGSVVGTLFDYASNQYKPFHFTDGRFEALGTLIDGQSLPFGSAFDVSDDDVIAGAVFPTMNPDLAQSLEATGDAVLWNRGCFGFCCDASND